MATSTCWRWPQLRRLATLTAGAGFPHNEQGNTDKAYPFYKVNALGRAGADGNIADRYDTVSKEAVARLGAKIHPSGSLVMAKIGAALLLGRVGILMAESCIDNNMLALTPRGGVSRRFLYYALQTIRLDVLVNPGAVPSLSERAFRAYPIPIPHLEAQHAIADFLDRETAKIDLLTEKQAALIDRLRERQRAMLWRLALGQQTNLETTSAWFGDPPDGWIIDKLGRRAKVVNGSTPSRDNPEYWRQGGYPWLNSSHANRDVVTAADQFVTADALAQCHLPILPPGTVLVGITGQGKTRGMATLLQIEATINQHLAAIVPDQRAWEPRYLTSLLRAAYAELRYISDDGGSTRGAITCAELHAFRVPRPPLEEQRRIAGRIDEETAKTQDLIAKAERFVDLVRERRSALITAAVTGEINVPGRVGS